MTHTLVIGDVHGNRGALLSVLRRAGAIDENDQRVPGFEIFSVGDVVNAAPMGGQYRGFIPDDYGTLKLVYEDGLIDKICVGNHELFFTHDRESGRFGGMAYDKGWLHEKLEPLMKQMVREGIYCAAVATHDTLVSHAGVAPLYQGAYDGKVNNPEEWAAWLNYMLAEGEPHQLLDAIGESVGGFGVGGIVWYRAMLDDDPPAHVPVLRQIVGHTIDTKHPWLYDRYNMWHIDNGGYMYGETRTAGLLWDGEQWQPVPSGGDDSA